MKTYTRAEVAHALDHAVLSPTLTDDDVRQHAAMCRDRGVGCLCVRPCDVVIAAAALVGSDTITASVIGFPHGNSRPETKALEARLAIQDGARELDMVMNISKFFSGDETTVMADIRAVVAEAKPKGVLVKVILETSLLTLEQVATACKLAQAGGADFVKTSTGFAGGGATPEAIDVMLKTVGTALKVKASGGIRSWETAVGYLAQGCQRLGVGSTETVLDGNQASGTY